MSISAINCTPIKPQVSFGNDMGDVERAQTLFDKTKELGDSFDVGEEKSTVGKAVSLLGLIGGAFILGKGAARKLLFFLPEGFAAKAMGFIKSIPSKLKAIKLPAKLADSNLAGKVKKFATDINSSRVVTKAKKVANDFGNSGVVTTVKEKLSGEKIQNVVEIIKGKTPEAQLTNIAGVAAAAVLGKEVSTIDGNEDGIPDIAQKGINAYQNAMKSMGVVEDIMHVLV